jgi:hypothetical protein
MDDGYCFLIFPQFLNIILSFLMSFTPPYNYPIQSNQFRLDPRQHNTSNKTLPQNPPFEKRNIGIPTTPMSVKDIDE